MLHADISIGWLFRQHVRGSVYVYFYPRVISDSLSIYRAWIAIGFYRAEKESTRERSVHWTERRFDLIEYINILLFILYI